MKYYNKDQIVFIELLDELKDLSIKYFKENKGILGFFKKEAGWYRYSISRHDYVIKLNKLPDSHYEKDGIVFTKPSIHINYINDDQYIYFNTNKERNLYFKRNFQDLKLINDI